MHEPIPFEKWSAAGNDFIVIEDSGSVLPWVQCMAPRVCRRHLSLGADGVILVRPSGPGRVSARFFNPDGSEFNMCMNGSRCVARYAQAHQWAGPELVLETRIGPIEARVRGRHVTLRFKREVELRDRLELKLGTETYTGALVRVGDPHLVIPVKEMKEVLIERVAPRLRQHPELGPDGANVNFVVAGTNPMVIRTYERGVEAETWACGSGCVSAALALKQNGDKRSRFDFRTRSGAVLAVELEPVSGNLWWISLTGEARRIAQGVLMSDAWTELS